MSREYHASYRAKNRDRLVTYKRKWNQDHKEHRKALRKRDIAKNARRFLNNDLKCKFGITLNQYESMLALQNHRCAICGVPQSELKRRMSVDHNHETGKVRSLLCNHCNTGLGYFRDSEQILTKAIKYLYEHSSCNLTAK